MAVRYPISWLFLFLSPIWVLATTVDDGLQALEQGDYRGAREIWLPLSENGDLRAAYYMSLLYAQGKGVKENQGLAMVFLDAAARGGFAVAQFNLGNHYNTGKWVEEDPNLAAYWWRKAAAQGMPRAEHNLATLYLIGRGVDKDPHMALHWYRRAAKQGSAVSARFAEELAAEMESQGESGMEAGFAAPLEAQTMHSASTKVFGTEWVRNQQPQHFTLQLFAGQSRKAAKRFLEQYSLGPPLLIYPYQSGGKQLIGIAHGRYDNLAQAREAIGKLPPEVRKAGPWPRRFGDIQALIDASNEGSFQ